MSITDPRTQTAGIDRAAVTAAAEARIADLRRTLAGDRETSAAGARRHADVIAVSTGHPVPADPAPAAPGVVNTHPGPDFYPQTGVAA